MGFISYVRLQGILTYPPSLRGNQHWRSPWCRLGCHLSILSGNGTPAQNAAVAINTAALLYIGKKASSLKEGVAMALEALKSGQAVKTLNEVIASTREE